MTVIILTTLKYITKKLDKIFDVYGFIFGIKSINQAIILIENIDKNSS